MTAKDKLLLVLCGAILLMTQFITVREIGSTFFSTEIVSLIAVITILIGPTIAYGLAPKINQQMIHAWGAITFVALVSLPCSIRFLAASSGKSEHLVLVCLFLFGGFLLSGFFAVFLPLTANDKAAFKTLYALELAGAALGLLVIATVPSLFSSLTYAGGWHALLIVFWLITVLAIHIAAGNTWVTVSALAIVCGAALYYPDLDKAAAKFYFENYWKIRKPIVLETCYSPYQRIDVLDTDKGRCLFLDGIPYYDPEDLHWFNFYIAEIPGKLVSTVSDKKRALIIGSGSLSSTTYLLNQNFDVTTVELDKQVARMGLKYFSKPDPRMHIVYEDARRFIGQEPDTEYDLIVLDVPAPYHIQTALLYTPDFFLSLKRCLKKSGIVAINTCSDEFEDETGSAITAGAASVFQDMIGLRPNSVGLSLLYCSDKLSFDQRKLASLAPSKERGFTTYDNASLRNLAAGKKPHDRDHLLALLVLSRWMLEGAAD